MSALEYSSGAKADIVGKPETAFFLSSIRDLNVQPDECLMIGDVKLFIKENYLFLIISN